jgi:hypothetical protein
MQTDQIQTQRLIADLLRVTGELRKITSRPFTPDGHLVGSLGEVLAANAYGLSLEPPSTKACDARDKDGRRIEIKATFGKRVAFRRHDVDCQPDHCLVLRLREDAGFDEIYNGPIHLILDRLSERSLPSNGQLQISLSQLQMLNRTVRDVERLRRVDGPSVAKPK